MMEELNGLYELPHGWIQTQLGEIAEITLGQSPPSSTYNEDGRGLPFYQGKLEFGKLYPTPRKWCMAPKKIAEKGDVLISVRAPVGPTNICPEKSCIGRGLAAIRGLDGIRKFFIFYVLRAFENEIARKGTGTTFSAIGGDKLKELEIPLPPLNEQERIVAKLEELFARLDAGVEGLQKVKTQLKRYRQAVLNYAFEGKLTEEWRKTHQDQIEPATKLLEKITKERMWNLKKNKKLSPIGSFELPTLAEGWIWTRVDWLCDVQTGPFGTQLHRNDYTSSGIPTIEIGDVHPTRNLKEGTAHFIAKEKAIELKRFEVKHGDVLFSRVGTVGRCTIVPEGCDGWIMSTSLIRVRIVSKYLLPKHLLSYFWSPIAQGFAKRTSKGTTRAGTNSRIVGELPLIIPPIMEQQIIVEEIERRLTEVDNIEQTLNQNLTRASRLRQSILNIAFEGKLVPQEPIDEPAEKLLERIREERAKSKGEKDINKKKIKRKQLELSTYVK